MERRCNFLSDLLPTILISCALFLILTLTAIDNNREPRYRRDGTQIRMWQDWEVMHGWTTDGVVYWVYGRFELVRRVRFGSLGELGGDIIRGVCVAYYCYTLFKCEGPFHSLACLAIPFSFNFSSPGVSGHLGLSYHAVATTTASQRSTTIPSALVQSRKATSQPCPSSSSSTRTTSVFKRI